jgi:hypothetical protein
MLETATLPYSGHPKGGYHSLPGPPVRIISLFRPHLSREGVTSHWEAKRPNAVVSQAADEHHLSPRGQRGTLCTVKLEEHGWIHGSNPRTAIGVITGPLATATAVVTPTCTC